MHHRLLRLALLAAIACGCAPSDADADPLATEARYLALGDSFTIGTGSSAAQSFPSRLRARWTTPRCRVTLRNPAVNGYTTQDVLDRELPEARPFAPTVVTLAVGANDLVRGSDVARYRAQLGRIFDALAAAGVRGEQVVTIPQPAWASSPVGASFGDPTVLAAQIEAFNTALREVSTARGARYIDLGEMMRTQAREGWIAPDGLHPDARAHDAWAEALARALPSPCR